uniref:Uncharacterized protein n=1 Tax=Rhizophora mucronata TaxID=61149 RepID=A0A2P2IYU8_RHIMU
MLQSNIIYKPTSTWFLLHMFFLTLV